MIVKAYPRNGEEPKVYKFVIRLEKASFAMDGKTYLELYISDPTTGEEDTPISSELLFTRDFSHVEIIFAEEFMYDAGIS